MGSQGREFSEKIAQQIDEEIAGIIEETHGNVSKILTHRRDMLEKLAKILLEKESIDGEELTKFMDEVKAMVAKDDSKEVA
jgi:cell division protease FtsH